MRLMIKAILPNERANALARAGRLTSMLEKIMKDLQPEAVYFADCEGQRTAYLFVQAAENSDIPRLVEPLFLAMDAEVEIHPAMNAQDLAKAAAHIQAAGMAYV